MNPTIEPKRPTVVFKHPITPFSRHKNQEAGSKQATSMNKPTPTNDGDNYSATGAEETHHTDTQPDAEAGDMMIRMSQQPKPVSTSSSSRRPPSVHERSAASSPHKSKNKALTCVALLVVAATALFIVLGITIWKNDDEAANPKEGWLPVDELYSYDLSRDGNALVVAGVGTASNQTTLRLFAWDGSSWQEETRLPLRDEHPMTEPAIQLATDRPYPKILVSDSHAVAHDTEFPGYMTHTGLAQIYTFGENKAGVGVYELTQVLDYADAVAMDEFGHRLAIGTPGHDEEDMANVGSIQVISLARDDGTVYGTQITGSEGHGFLGEALALSGNGRVLVAGTPVKFFDQASAGIVRTWHWNDAAQHWFERTAVLRGDEGQGLGKQVVLSRGGDILAVTTAFSKQAVIYQHQVRNAIEADNATGHWEFMGSAISDVSSIQMTSDGKRIATVGSVPGMVQVYDWSDVAEDWVAVGDAVEGTAARLADDGTLVVETRNADGPFLRILQVE